MELFVILGLCFSRQKQLCAASLYYLRSCDVATRQTQSFWLTAGSVSSSCLLHFSSVGWVGGVSFEVAENDFLRIVSVIKNKQSKSSPQGWCTNKLRHGKSPFLLLRRDFQRSVETDSSYANSYLTSSKFLQHPSNTFTWLLLTCMMTQNQHH